MKTTYTERAEMNLVQRIHERYVAMCKKNGVEEPEDLADTRCDFYYARKHLNLDLEALLAFDDFNFAHDIFGIKNNIVRVGALADEGKMRNNFLPRCCRPAKVETEATHE